MTQLKDLKRKHKKLETLSKKVTKQRLNDLTSDSMDKFKRVKKIKIKTERQDQSIKTLI